MDFISLKDYLASVRQAVACHVEADVWVRAEISELKVNGSGHCYLTLVEKEESGKMNVCAKAAAIIWANLYNMVAPMFESVTHQPLQRGMTVLVRVSPNFHEAYGFSLIISDIDPAFTLGDMARRRQEVIDKLKADGVWDMNHEQQIPLLPQRVAVISSETAAGFGDFINQLEHNDRQFKFYWHLFPAVMQGDGAPSSIMAALDEVFVHAALFDVVVIVRGGGASADMLAFDDYDLASCCAQFPLPIISGVGHERDTCVVDLVACRRCKTPTAVGALLVDCMEQAYARVEDATLALATGARQILKEEKNRLATANMLLAKTVPLALAEEKNRLTNLCAALRVAVSDNCKTAEASLQHSMITLKSVARLMVRSAEMRVGTQIPQLSHAVRTLITSQQSKIELMEQKVDLLSPQTLLKKGYSLTLNNGRVVRSANDLQKGDKIETIFADGRRTSIVE